MVAEEQEQQQRAENKRPAGPALCVHRLCPWHPSPWGTKEQPKQQQQLQQLPRSSSTNSNSSTCSFHTLMS